MAISPIDKILYRTLQWVTGVAGTASAEDRQLAQLRWLLQQAQQTTFGKTYGFADLLRLPGWQVYEAFKERVPVFTYDQMAAIWWNRTLAGEADVCWPDKIPFVAISSGTSGTYRKQIPMSRELIASNRQGAMRQILAFPTFGLPYRTLLGQTLMLGETTTLVQQGAYREGYMSSIMLEQMPGFARMRMKPEASIRKTTEWQQRINQIITKAPEWDIHGLSGLPSWTCLLFEQIIQHHRLNSLHDIWPNLSVFAHGGLSFEPYRAIFRQYLSRDIVCLDSYIASEGYLACQTDPAKTALTLQLDIGLFLEFIPFDSGNFDDSGQLRSTHQALCIRDVKPGIEYALVLTNPAGAWRYLLGDTIRFTSTDQNEIEVAGRIQHFINLCGEHLIMANMLEALAFAKEQLTFSSPEFTILPRQDNKTFYHEWFIGYESGNCPIADELAALLDQQLRQINVYYRELRDDRILQLPQVRLFPKQWFYSYLKKVGKEGGQHKFPRVLTGLHQQAWLDHVDACYAALDM